MLAQAIRKKLGKAGKEEKGFTLIELLAVIVILGVIAVIAIPLIGNVIEKSKNNSDVATARQVYDAARLYVVSEKNGDFIESIANTGAGASGSHGLILTVASATATDVTLQSTGFLESPIYLPSDKTEITSGTVEFTTTGDLLKVDLVTSSGTHSFSAAKVMAVDPSK
ncbi:type II secretion system protein [Paenibacillus typhae]|uniref:Type IV pilus assembly protein PilA n=1 Tax=Paenibacillus typhae TaxID=1174501 RepID=A0A1G8NFA5_9BACL|nr:prepilin-type N-terminal cleavage/methylation domain-containing protein [Paenibacillus typhae]SDI78929.1 type IV pilus assembly protein PilA [Paenibacillus typhae]